MPRDAAALADRLEAAGNDLEAAAIGLVPEVGEALALLRDVPGCLLARMSGSGATCFGLFAARDEAVAAARRIAAVRPDWWAVAAPLLHGKLDRSWWDETAA